MSREMHPIVRYCGREAWLGANGREVGLPTPDVVVADVAKHKLNA